MPKISALTELAAGAVAADDLVPVVDTSATATKKVQVKNLRHYKVYVALLLQAGTDAPTATVLENTLGGSVVWSRSGAGDYRGTLVGAFVANKTLCLTTHDPQNSGNTGIVSCARLSDDAVILTNFVPTEPALLDGAACSIEIRVYPA